MPASGPDTLQALTSFTVTAGDRADEASFEVWQPGGRQPVARLRQADPSPVSPDSERAGPIATQPSFDVLAGTQLNQFAGRVTLGGAWAPDGTPVGTVKRRSGRLEDLVPSTGLPALLYMGDSQWRVRQDGLPVITGQRSGLGARVRFNGLTNLVSSSDVLADRGAIAGLPFTFRFKARGTEGFEIARPAGQPRLAVTVHDPRINRLLVLSCVLSINVIHRSRVRHSPRARRA